MKRNLLILLTVTLLCAFIGCGSETTLQVNVQNEQNLSGTTLGKDSLIYIGNKLYYDASTRIVYWWNGWLTANEWATTPSPYYAPNGLPYKYNPETNTLEEITWQYLN